MIISASRRTDIPACYSDWFMNRLMAGEVLVPNPYNRKKINRIPLSPDTVDCIVFWTKNPEPILPRLREIDEMGYSYYFQMTITDYESDVEAKIPSTEESIATFMLLSERIGKEKVDWRFDPIIFTEKYSLSYHLEQFEMICQWLHKYTTRCIISFVDSYQNTKFKELERGKIRELAAGLSGIAKKYGLTLYTCAEEMGLEQWGIRRSACIDREKIEKLVGYKMDVKKDASQRRECGCAESIDIGMYDTCRNGCEYCYAVKSKESAEKKYKKHNQESPLLIGELQGDEIITDKRTVSCRDDQMSLFDFMK